jgi:hypothetical protein
MNRQCNRFDCGATATATLSFDYGTRTAWLVDVTQPHPATYGLCGRHADRLRVPIGWSLQDQRADRSPATGVAATRAS